MLPLRSLLTLSLAVALAGCSCEEEGGAAQDEPPEQTRSEGAAAGEQGAEADEAGDDGAPADPLAEALYVERSSYDFEDNPELLERILSHAHGYFRFINIAFSQAVCERFSDVTSQMPAVNLHGDAHLEQYAITEQGRGLSDFDDSSTGPCLIDLVRFGVSLRLAAEANGWEDRAAGLFDRFLEGYRAALEDPEVQVERPPIVEGIRESFPEERKPFLDEIEGLMKPLAFEPSELDAPLAKYREMMHAQDPELRKGFFETKGLGSLHVGVGSALDEKYLWRVEGETDAPQDDVVLEIKEVRDLEGIECLDVSRRDDPFRIMVASSRISYRPYKYVGYVRWHDKTFWIHAWVDNYRELDIDESLRSPEGLEAIVYDVGVQLGRGHPSEIADPLDLQLRRALVQILDDHGDRIRAAVAELAAATVEAWKHFRAEAG